MKKIYKALLCCSISFSLYAGIDTWQKNRKAVQLYAAQQYEQALEHYNELIVNDPYNAVYNYNIAEILYRQKQYELAAQSYKRVPKYADKKKQLAEHAWYGAGNSFYQLKQWQDAIEMYEQALKINSENEQTRHNLRLAQQNLLQEQQKKEEQSEQDKDDNNKGDDQKDSQDQQDAQDDQNQDGDDSQNDAGSQSEKQSQGTESKEHQKGSPDASGKGKPSKDTTSDAGSDNQDESSQNSGQQDDVDSPGEKSSDEKKSHQEKNGKQEEQDLSDDDTASLDKSDDGTSKKGEDKDLLQDAQEKSLDEKLQEHQKNLDDVAADIEENSRSSHNKPAGLQENSDKLQDEQSKENASSQLQDVQDAAQQNELKKPASMNSQKQLLKNNLQELYESKSSEDDRLNSYYSDIMQALENQEEHIQRQIIKNKVAEKMVGQHGKKGW